MPIKKPPAAGIQPMFPAASASSIAGMSRLQTEAAINPIGAVINGTHPGRSSAEEITLFDGTGVGLQDLAVAAKVVELAKAAGKAIEVEV